MEGRDQATEADSSADSALADNSAEGAEREGRGVKGLPSRCRATASEKEGESRGEVGREGAEELADRLGMRRKATGL